MKNTIESLRNEYRQLREEAVSSTYYKEKEFDSLVADMIVISDIEFTPENYVATARSLTEAIRDIAEADALIDWQMVERVMNRS